MIRSRFSIYVGDSPRAQEAYRVAELLRSSGNFFDVLAGIDHVHASVDFPDDSSVNEQLHNAGFVANANNVAVYLQQKHEKEDAHYRLEGENLL